MAYTTFYILFGVTWFVAMAYALCAVRLLLRLKGIQAQGRAADAPNPMTNSFAIFGYLVWLLTGRYADIGDPIVTRWSGIARVLFVLAAPLILTVFVLALRVAALTPAAG